MAKFSVIFALVSAATSGTPSLTFWASNSAVSERETADVINEDMSLEFWASNSAVIELENVAVPNGDARVVDVRAVDMEADVVGMDPGAIDLLHGSSLVQGSVASDCNT